jgi:signal transduction histidine kinase
MACSSVEPASEGARHALRPRPSLPRASVGPAVSTPVSRPRLTLRQLNGAAGARQAAVQQERARIARELHDGVSQTLYAITLGASRALTHLQQNQRTEVQRLIDDLLKLANTGQSELRALLTDIRSNRLTSAGLVCALEHLAVDTGTLDGPPGLDIRLSASHEPDVSAPIKDALLMIVREALHNAVKHADAHRVDIALEHSGGHLLLLIEDDGRGFDPSSSRPGHFGLQSMRERATAVGGTFTLFSTVGAGTQLRVSIPVPEDTDG